MDDLDAAWRTASGHRVPVKVAVFCGAADPFYVATRRLVDLMRFPHEARFGPGGHDDAYWSRVAPAQLRAIGLAMRDVPASSAGEGEI